MYFGRMKKHLILAALLLLTCKNVVAQEQDKPMPDRWHGMIIDKSTPDDAIKALGQPLTDKPETFKPYPLEKRITSKGRIFRQLHYKNVTGLDSVRLVFTDDKLVAIILDLREKIPAPAIPNNYGIEFEPKISGMDSSMNPGAYERHEGKLYPKNYPAFYYLVGTTPKVWVAAGIGNSSTSSILFGSSRGSTGTGAFPGKAENILILSRSLEHNEGADVLK
jgi:hypothetical protein